MRKRDNPEAWNELLESMSQGDWEKAIKIVKDNDFYQREEKEAWQNTWIVTTPKGDKLTFRTAKEIAKELRMSQTSVTRARKTGMPVKGYTITRVDGDER